jgi:glucose/arabinose dehydrogenase
MRLPAITCALPLVAGLLVATGAALAAPQTFRSSAGNLTVETVASGLANPWALAFLPDGRILVTEKPGRMRIVGKDGKLSPALAGVPQVFARRQGGLHDVVLALRASTTSR